MKNRTKKLVGMLVVCGMVVLGLYLGDCFKDFPDVWGSSNVTDEQLMRWRIDPLKLAEAAVEDAKCLLFPDVSINELIQRMPVAPRGSNWGVDWEQKTYDPYYIIFYYEEVNSKESTVRVIRNFCCSPSFALRLGPKSKDHLCRTANRELRSNGNAESEIGV